MNIEHLSEQGSVLAWKRIMPIGVQVELALDPYSMFSMYFNTLIDGHHFWNMWPRWKSAILTAIIYVLNYEPLQ